MEITALMKARATVEFSAAFSTYGCSETCKAADGCCAHAME